MYLPTTPKLEGAFSGKGFSIIFVVLISSFVSFLNSIIP